MNRYLLDTNSIIYALNGGLKLPDNDYIISVITEIELLSYSKLSQQDEYMLKSALSHFRHIGLSDDIKIETINIRKHSNLKLPDSLIAATANVENAILVTSDKRLLNSNIVKTVELDQIV